LTPCWGHDMGTFLWGVFIVCFLLPIVVLTGVLLWAIWPPVVFGLVILVVLVLVNGGK
jgi:hypothetical protein